MIDNKKNRDILAANIRKYMRLNNLNQKEVCKTLSISPSTFSYWLNSKAYPRIDKIELLAQFFGVYKADLIEDHSTEGFEMLLDEEEADLIYDFRDADDIIRETAVDILRKSANKNREAENKKESVS